MISRRSFATQSLSFGIGATLCTPSITRAAQTETLRILAPEGSEANVLPAINSFEEQTGCNCEMVVVGVDEINAVLTLEALLGEFRVDVALPATFGIPDLAEAQAILPLDALAKRLGPNDLSKQLLYQAGDRFDGQLWGYQTDGDVFLMFYNKTLMEDEKLSAEYEELTGQRLTAPKTWEELDRQMAFFHRPSQDIFGGCLFRSQGFVAWEWWARLHAKGSWPLSANMQPLVAEESGVEALEDMIASSAHLDGDQLGLFENWDRYKRGNVYANIGWGGTQKDLRLSGMGPQILNAPLPGGILSGSLQQMSYFNWGWSYVVARNSRFPDTAYRFCANAVSREVGADAIAQADGFFDPFRADQYNEPKIVAAYGREFLKVHKQAMSSPIPDLYIARRSEYFDALSYWLIAALKGEATAKGALENVARSWETTTRRVGEAAQIRRWAALRRTYPKNLRERLGDG